MDEDINIINTKTRNEKIKNFFVNNRKIIISIVSVVIILLLSYFSYKHLQKNKKIELANSYNLVVNNYNLGNKSLVIDQLKNIIKAKDKTYSPLALYYLIDN